MPQTASALDQTPPAVRVQQTGGNLAVALSGQWTLRGIADHAERLFSQLQPYATQPETHWDLSGIEALDSAGAFIMWRACRGQRPPHLVLRPEHIPMFRRWTERRILQGPAPVPRRWSVTDALAHVGERATQHAAGFLSLLGQVVLDLAWLLRHPRHAPWRDLSATIYLAGVRALMVTALVGFLLGVVLSYLSAQQLKGLGAADFIITIVGVGILREMGPLLAAIIVAGRSGSAMAAQFGVMRVTQELDALAAMGVSPSLRLVLPKVVGLAVALPLLVVWTDALALVGGILTAQATLGLEVPRFLHGLPTAVPIVNLWLGVGKGAAFGALIGLLACYFGLRIKPDTESLGIETTNAVVASITMVLILDALFAVMFRNSGLL